MDNIHLVQLSNYVKPEIKESYGRKWVLNGDKNSFFQYIIDRKNGSPTNSGIINRYHKLLFGRGIAQKGQEEVDDALVELFSKDDQRNALSDMYDFGMYALKLVRSVGGGVGKVKHFPMNKLAMGKADSDGEINEVYYSFDWSNTNKYTPQPIKLFKGKMTDKEMILLYSPYQSGSFYYKYPSYLAGLQYAEIEEEISNFSINHIKNGLSFGYVINFNNGGATSDEQREEIERRIKQKLTGSSNAGKFILSFNEGKEAEVTVVPLDVNDAHNQWESLREDAKYQILTSHGVTSPLLFSIQSSTGFSSNADELDTALDILYDTEILPRQEAFIDTLKPVLEIAGLETDLEFIKLRESYKKEETTEEVIDETVDDLEEETEERVEMSSNCCGVCLSDDNEATPELAEHLISFGEYIDEKDYELLTEGEVDYETDDLIYQLVQFATSTGVARPNAKSEQDNDDIVIRYRYVDQSGRKGFVNPNSREFCQKMMRANKLYRKEDIMQMERSGINDGFGLNGTNSYSIWLYKGGGKISEKYPNGTCKHKWWREIYLKRNGSVDVNSPLAQSITVAEARRRGYNVPKNDPKVGRTPNQNKS